MTDYMYLVRTRESMRLGENVYKIGKTGRGLERMRGYPKGSELLLMFQVPDCDRAERDLLAVFRRIFRARTDHGAEYFEGPPLAMLARICDYCLQAAGSIDWSRHAERESSAGFSDFYSRFALGPATWKPAVADYPISLSETPEQESAPRKEELSEEQIDSSDAILQEQESDTGAQQEQRKPENEAGALQECRPESQDGETEKSLLERVKEGREWIAKQPFRELKAKNGRKRASVARGELDEDVARVLGTVCKGRILVWVDEFPGMGRTLEEEQREWAKQVSAEGRLGLDELKARIRAHKDSARLARQLLGPARVARGGFELDLAKLSGLSLDS